MKILGIDFGEKRIGLAVSDESATLSRELFILSPKEFWAQIDGIITEQGIGLVVLGLPLNMSGEDSEKTREAKEFADQLRDRISVPVEMIDERLSSVMAGNISGGSENIDSLAAQIILQNYLDKNKNVGISAKSNN